MMQYKLSNSTSQRSKNLASTQEEGTWNRMVENVKQEVQIPQQELICKISTVKNKVRKRIQEHLKKI